MYHESVFCSLLSEVTNQKIPTCPHSSGVFRVHKGLSQLFDGLALTLELYRKIVSYEDVRLILND